MMDIDRISKYKLIRWHVLRINQWTICLTDKMSTIKLSIYYNTVPLQLSQNTKYKNPFIVSFQDLIQLKMSELAEFVAAAIKDKVVLELIEENKKLKELLHVYNKLEVTGKGASPVYICAKQNLDGMYEKMDDGKKNDTDKDEILTLPLKSLPDIEIRMGGSPIMPSLWENSWGFVEEESSINFIFEEERANGKLSVELTVVVEGWPEERWSSLERVDPQKVFETLMHSIPSTDDMKVKFVNISAKLTTSTSKA